MKILNENKMIKMYAKNQSASKIGDTFGVHETTILRRLKNNKIYTGPKTISTNDELEIIKHHSKSKSSQKTSNFFHIRQKTVSQILKKYNIKLNSSRKYKCDDSYFEKIDSEDKAYFLGFLFADGAVRKKDKKYSFIRLKIHKKDLHILRKFNECLNSTYPIKYEKGHDGSLCMVRIGITSIKMTDDLIRHGCMPNKSLILKFPKTIPEKLLHHFIRGYFDGDGCISYTKIQKCNKRPSGSIVGTKDVLNNIEKAMFSFNKNISLTKISKKGKIFVLSFGGCIKCCLIREYLYRNASIFLYRKKEIFNKIKSSYRHSTRRSNYNARKNIKQRNSCQQKSSSNGSKNRQQYNVL